MTTEQLKENLLKEQLFRADGNLNSSKFKVIESKYDLSNVEGDDFTEKIFLLFKGNRGYCEVCGKQAPFRSYRLGYYKTCGNPDCKKALSKEIYERNRDSIEERKDEINAKRKKTCLERYGVENPQQVEEVKKKSSNTCLEKYGTRCVFQAEEIKEKIKETCLEKYGTERACQSEQVKEKIAQINLEKYGAKTNLIAPEYKERIRQHNLEKYGVDHYSKTDEYKEKYKKTCLERYGVENALQSEDIKEKIRKTNLKKYGFENAFKSGDVQQKFKENFIKKHGVDHPSKLPEVRTKYLSHRGMTSPESKLDYFLHNRNFNYRYNYSLETEDGVKNFDFVIFVDNKPELAIEIDGMFYHGLMSDTDGGHVRGDKDNERFLKTPKGCKLLVIDENKIDEGISEILRLLDINYDDWIDEIISSLPKDFPYYNYPEERLRKDYEHLHEYSKVSPKGRLADSTIKNFHKSIYHAHVGKYPSPFEAWYNKDLLRRCVENRFVYSSDLSSHSILGGFNVCKIAPKVSVFSASLARYLIEKYLGEYDEIFDPFSGFSGRLLGTCASGKRYVGQDINLDHVKESNEIIKFHNLQKATVIRKDILESSGDYECLFTCPPYGGKEHWNILNDEIEKSCDEWIGECLKRFKCEKYLFVVDETEKYKDNIVETIKNQSHFGTKEEKVILI